jgi:hypothetical protein
VAGGTLLKHQAIPDTYTGLPFDFTNSNFSLTADGVYDANSVLLTTLVDNTFSHGMVGLYQFSAGQTSFSDFSVTGTLAVPEPSTWAMLLLGFAGLGFTAYRRKSTLALMTA